MSSVHIDFRGHPEVQAADPQALEILDSDEWSRRPAAIGYRAVYRPAELLALRGRVRVEVQVGQRSDAFEATIASTFHRGLPLVFRRDTLTRSKPLAWQSSKASSDLERELILSLRERDAVGHLRLMQIAAHPVEPGTLVIIAMPLGNQADLSPRAIEVLSSVDAILAEDTRVAEQNLRWRGIRTPVVSCYQQNEPKRAREVRERLLRGDRLALISDAGTPLISDPGYLVVQAAREIGAHLQAIPGPSAVMLSLMLSALPVEGFHFRGFVPRKASERKRFMSEVLASQETTVLFEASSRLTALLRHVERIATDRQIAVCKDLTKRSETVFRGSAAAVLEQVSAQADARGEYTIVVAAGPESTQARRSESESTDVFIEALLRADCPIAPIVQASAELWGVSKQEAYRRTLAWKKAARHRAGGEEGQQGQ